MKSLDGRVIVVTGGGRGLGRAFALELAARGARVVVNNRNRVVDDAGRGPADHVVAETRANGGEAVAEHGDVADPATARRIVELALGTWGRIDGCVTSAAIGDIFFIMIRTRKVAIMAKPRTVSMGTPNVHP